MTRQSGKLRLPVPVLAVAMIASAGVGLGNTPATASTLFGANAGTAYATAGPAASAAPALPAVTQPNVFTIGGSVSGLYPGATRQFVLTVANPQPYPITVLSIFTTVQGLTAGCSFTTLTVSKFSGSLSIPPKQWRHAVVSAHMAHAAPNACQGAHFQLLYTGTADAA